MKSNRAWSFAVLAFSAGSVASAQQPPPDGTPAAPARADAGAVASANAAPAPGQPVVSDNFVLAAANSQVFTVRDLMLEWRLELRNNADPKHGPFPSKEESDQLKKQIVMDQLWLDHGRAHPLYAENVKPRMIDGWAKDMFGALFDDLSVPQDERDLMRRKAEVEIARQISMQNDPQFQRCQQARPDDVQRYWEMRPDMHRQSTRVQLGRVILARENDEALYGAPATELVQKIRQRAIELGSLEAAAKELAPGSYQAMAEKEIERDTSLRQEILDFAKKAEPSELSTPIVGDASVMLFSLITRTEGKDVTFEEAAAGIKRTIERRRSNIRVLEYFVTRVLALGFFVPDHLFDDDIELFNPGYKDRKARMQAGPPKK